MNRPQKIVMRVVIGLVLLALGAVGGWWWAQHALMPLSATAESVPTTTPPAETGTVLYWYDPMVPLQRFDKPGKSPFMDMELVPKYADAEPAGAAAGMRIDPRLSQNLGMRLATVKRIPLATQIAATGIIGFNERDVAVVQSRTNGFVERVWPLAPGDRVKVGQPLVELLVPEWAGAQHELLAVKTAGDAALLAAARERLRLLGMAEALIVQVERSGSVQPRITLRAPIAGLLQELEVRTGMTLMPGQSLARINGLATVWLEAAVPEALAGKVRIGTKAEVRLTAAPGEVMTGTVTTLLPALNEAARTLRVRIELPNRDGHLRAGLSAQITLTSSDKGSALAVPTEAIIRTGKRALVMVTQEQGRFTPVAVTLGHEIENQTVITSGLREGEQIISSGQFLIDSEASLSGVEARTGHTGAHP